MKDDKSETIAKMKMDKYDEQNGICPACGKPFAMGDKVELAHLVPQRKWLKEKYGEDAIQHPLNMKLTHSGECNSRVQLNPEHMDSFTLMEEIRSILDDR